MAELESTVLNGLTFSIFESIAAPKKKELTELIKKYGGAVSYMISNSVSKTHSQFRISNFRIQKWLINLFSIIRSRI